MVLLESGKEGTLVVNALNESVDSVTVGLYGSTKDCTVVVLHFVGLTNGFSATRDGLVVDTSSIVNSESNVLHTVTVLGVVLRELLVVGLQGGLEGENNIASTDNMGAELTLTSLKTL